MQNDSTASDRIVARNSYQQRVTRRLVASNLVSGLIIAGLVGDRIWLGRHPPQPKIILTDSHGNQVEVHPLDEPVMSDADLLNWVARAAVAPYNFDYVHYRDTLSREARPFFTTEGWNNVVTSMKERKNIEEVVRSSMVAEAAIDRPPTLVNGGVKDGILQWAFEVPIAAAFRNTTERRDQRLLVKMTVIRTAPLFHPAGVAVDSYIAKPI